MNGTQFIKKVRRIGGKNGVAVRFDKAQGKGSHGTLFYGSRSCTVKDRKKELRIGLLNAMINQLGLSRNDF